jgi:putative transposase
MGLELRNKSPKRRVKTQLREDRSPATAANQVWAMDFVHDQLFDGRKIRILTVVDTCTRLSPAIDVRQQFRGADVVQTLERVSREIGFPKTIRLDNGPEFISKELDLWASCAASRSTSAGRQTNRQRLHRLICIIRSHSAQNGSMNKQAPERP